MLTDWAEERIVANVVQACDTITQYATNAISSPSVLYRPELSIDGNQYCFLLGSDLQSGVAGFGDTPQAAAWDFDRNFQIMKVGTPR